MQTTNNIVIPDQPLTELAFYSWFQTVMPHYRGEWCVDRIHRALRYDPPRQFIAYTMLDDGRAFYLIVRSLVSDAEATEKGLEYEVSLGIVADILPQDDGITDGSFLPVLVEQRSTEFEAWQLVGRLGLGSLKEFAL